MMYEQVTSKDSCLKIEREVSSNIVYFAITGDALNLDTRINNREEIADEVQKIIGYCNDNDLSRSVALELCAAIMRSMIAEGNAPQCVSPLDRVNEYLDIIFGERENAEFYKVGTKREDNT